MLNGFESNWSHVPSGVPQGSVLGPLLFLIFINDIDTAIDAVHCVLIKFADDTKGLQKVDSPNDAHKLQNNLNHLFDWSKEWQMLFNLEQCHVLHFGSKNPKNTYNSNSC